MGDLLTAQTLVDLAVELESVGWDGVLLEDYLVYYRGDDPATYDPWLVLAAVAGRTSTLTLGTGVTGLLARDPVKLAREALTLRDLSGGRVVLGVGLGDPADRGASIDPAVGPAASSWRADGRAARPAARPPRAARSAVVGASPAAAPRMPAGRFRSGSAAARRPVSWPAGRRAPRGSCPTS